MGFLIVFWHFHFNKQGECCNQFVVWVTYCQWLIKNHWSSFLINASLCSARHPDTELMALNTVLFRKLNLVLEWTIVLWLLFKQRRDNEACTLRQGWVWRVFPMHSNTELHIHVNSNSDKDFICRSWHKIVQLNLIVSKLGIWHISILFHFAGWYHWNSTL